MVDTKVKSPTIAAPGTRVPSNLQPEHAES